jgi:hypothetical protein
MFESFDVTPELKVRRSALRQPRFVLDVHLGRLAAICFPPPAYGAMGPMNSMYTPQGSWTMV